ncbi:MAG TPA: hypothetical protein VL983_10445 [Terriglobales bacterium]|nr:hypothetical protein [Terriglobales bacterium]
MSARRALSGISLLAVLAALTLFSACTIAVKDKDNKNGDSQVDIKTPVGDLHVGEQVDIRDAGLSIYPGATPAPKEDSSEKSANLNISVPGFQLKVVAGEFLSNDAPDKVVAYYDKELGKFGKPIQCHGWNTGQAAASGGEDAMSKPVSCSPNSAIGDSIELKVGTEGNQHLVSVKPNNKGSRFALVFVRMHTGKDTTI